MVSKPDKNKARLHRHVRVRGKVSGTAARPRLNVFRSSKHIYAQLIDDVAGVTLASASTMDKSFEGFGGNKEAAWPWPAPLPPRASRRLCLTAADISITAALRSWPRAPARVD